MANVILSLGDKHWDFDDAEIELKDAFAIKAATGLNLKPFLEGVAEMDPLSIQGLVWFVRHKAGEKVNLADINFRLADLKMDQPEVPAAEAVVDAGATVDPTQAVAA
jgi:hypothetical protein